MKTSPPGGPSFLPKPTLRHPLAVRHWKTQMLPLHSPLLLSSCPPFIVATLLLLMYILIVSCQILAVCFLEFEGYMFARGEEMLVAAGVDGRVGLVVMVGTWPSDGNGLPHVGAGRKTHACQKWWFGMEMGVMGGGRKICRRGSAERRVIAGELLFAPMLRSIGVAAQMVMLLPALEVDVLVMGGGTVLAGASDGVEASLIVAEAGWIWAGDGCCLAASAVRHGKREDGLLAVHAYGREMREDMGCEIEGLNPLVVAVILARLDRLTGRPAGAHRRQLWLPALVRVMEHHIWCSSSAF
ncbi:hypothetical protein ACLOJK_039096 [Asimina triloba]